MLQAEHLQELSDKVAEDFLENSVEIISMIFAKGKIDEFLELTGQKHFKDEILSKPKIVAKKILVIGQTSGNSEKDFKTMAQNMGVDPNSLELYLDYHDAKKINFEKFRNKPEYCAIMIGPMPHSGKSKGDYSSVVRMLEEEPGFPRIIKLGENGLKLNITSFQKGICQLAMEGLL